jgi:hypothetical protein
MQTYIHLLILLCKILVGNTQTRELHPVEERVLNPIITWNGYIVDGHTRYQVLRKYPFIPFEVIEKEFSSRYEALAWICKNQLGRRNLTPEQKKFLIGKQAEAEKRIKSFHGNQYTFASDNFTVLMAFCPKGSA